MRSGFPCPKTKNGLPIHFKFNNSIPGAFNENEGGDIEEDGNNDEDEDDDDDEEEEGLKKCWDMGTKNMKEFFSDLKVIETKSLTLTKEVLRQRAQLEISIENIQMKVKLALPKLEEVKQESQILKTHKSAIKENEKFDYEVSDTRPVKVKTEEYSMNCEECNVTCHKSCWVKPCIDLVKKVVTPPPVTNLLCEAFAWSGKCKECKGECPPTKHALEAFYWGSETVIEKKTYEDLKKKYETASKEAMSVGDIIKQMELEYARLHEEVVRLMERSAQCLNTLKEIALKPNPLSTPEYIDLLIEGEKSEAKPGYQERIKKLQHMRGKAVTMGLVARGAKLL